MGKGNTRMDPKINNKRHQLYCEKNRQRKEGKRINHGNHKREIAQFNQLATDIWWNTNRKNRKKKGTRVDILKIRTRKL